MLARGVASMLLAVALAAPAHAAAGAADAQALVQKTLYSVLAVLRDKAMPADQRRAKV